MTIDATTGRRSVHWLTRTLGLVINSFYLGLWGLMSIRPERFATQTGPVLLCLGVCIVAVFSTWRWPRLGGLATVIGAIALGLSGVVSNGFGPAGLLVILVYAVPFGLVGGLSLMDAKMASA